MRAAHRQPTIIATSAYLPSVEKARNYGKGDHGSSPSLQAHNLAEYQHILESSGRRLQWVLDHPDTYWRRPVAFVPVGAGFRMASAELHPQVLSQGRVGCGIACVCCMALLLFRMRTPSPAMGCGWCVVGFELPWQRLGLVNAAAFVENETNQHAKAFDDR
jgi:hypothetical protein